MNTMLYLFLSFALFFSTACSGSDGRLQPLNVPSEQLTDTFYKNDTAVLKSQNLKFLILGEWSEKNGYVFEVTVENLTTVLQTFDAGKITLTGDRLEKAEIYLRRNGVPDPYSGGGDAEKNLIVINPSEKKKLFVQFNQKMKQEDYYAAGRKGDKIKIVLNSPTDFQPIEFEAVSTSDMKPVK